MTDPGALTLYIAGLGRCGTSMVLQMLAAGGAPVVGAAPDYERFDLAEMADPALLEAEVRGRAVKLLDPHRAAPNHPLLRLRPRHAIWLTRDSREQAKSQLNFVRTLGGDALYRPFVPDNRAARTAWQSQIIRDQARALGALKAANIPVTAVHFETILAEPLAMATRMASQLRPWWRLDPVAMAAVVVRRAPDWSGSLDLESAAAFAREAGL